MIPSERSLEDLAKVPMFKCFKGSKKRFGDSKKRKELLPSVGKAIVNVEIYQGDTKNEINLKNY